MGRAIETALVTLDCHRLSELPGSMPCVRSTPASKAPGCRAEGNGLALMEEVALMAGDHPGEIHGQGMRLDGH